MQDLAEFLNQRAREVVAVEEDKLSSKGRREDLLWMLRTANSL